MGKDKKIWTGSFSDWIASASLLIALGALVVSIIAIRSQEDIAQRSGAFDRAVAEPRIGDASLRDSDLMVFFGIDESDPALVQSAIPFVLENTGQLPIEDLSVTFRYPTGMRIGVREPLRDFSPTGRLRAGEMIRSFSQSGGKDFASYHFENLNAGETLVLTDPVMLQTTVFKESDRTVSIEEPIEAGEFFSIPVTVSVSGRNIRVQDHDFEVMVIAAMNSTHLLDNANQMLSRNPNMVVIFAKSDSTASEPDSIGIDATPFDEIYYPRLPK